MSRQQGVPSWLTSLLIHLALLLLLGLIVMPSQRIARHLTLTLGDAEPSGESLETLTLEPAATGESTDEESASIETSVASEQPVVTPEVTLPTMPVRAANPADLAGSPIAGDAVAALTGSGEFAGRGGRRGQAVGLGATADSEQAVDRALVWLAAHQQTSGRWSFALTDCGCDGACSHAGVGSRATNGATALALLPFLGAGQTHQHGYHRKTIDMGLRYLIDQQAANGGFHEPQGTMYSHGLATLVLCESLAMTANDPDQIEPRYRRQRDLRQAAQRAIDYIVRHQHSGGGWRYIPGEKGDTSVVGWQAMALQSAKLAGLKVPKLSLDRMSRFLDGVMADDYGGQYGYLDRMSRPGTSAVGVLSRMYLGWDRTHPGVIAGAEYLAEVGPSANNVYFNYYATQVMHHYGGPLWENWHPLLRDHLVESQERKGHETGSWYFDHDFGSGVGGRLYITAMSAMTLEVYYRHMPIYLPSAVAQSQTLGDR